MGALGMRRPRRCLRRCRWWALYWRRNTPRLRQIIRATNS